MRQCVGYQSPCRHGIPGAPGIGSVTSRTLARVSSISHIPVSAARGSGVDVGVELRPSEQWTSDATSSVAMEQKLANLMSVSTIAGGERSSDRYL